MNTEAIEARKIVNGYLNLHSHVHDVNCAKDLSLFAVDRILDALDNISSFVNPDIYNSESDYWKRIKQEIESI